MALLEVSNVSVQFEGLRALSDFNFKLDKGELAGLIGPNGAGKTTAFNVVTGLAGGGREDCDGGKKIDGELPVEISHAGIARTFQNNRLFLNLSVAENVMVGFNRSAERGLVSTLLRTPHFLGSGGSFMGGRWNCWRHLSSPAMRRRRRESLPYG